MSYLEERRKHSQFGKPPKEKKIYSLKKVSDKKAAEKFSEKIARGGEKTDLEKWYEKIMQKEDAVCWETGNKINKSDKVAWHGSIAHVLGKKTFPSVAIHPLNYLILEMYGGAHGQYDSSWENASKMKVWKIAVERFLRIEPDIAWEERKNIPDVFLREIKDPFE